MKSTGILRKVDELGRVVIPIELRRTLGIEEKDALEIYVDGDKIVLKKYVPSELEAEKERVIKNLEKVLSNANSMFAMRTIEDAIKLLK